MRGRKIIRDMKPNPSPAQRAIADDPLAQEAFAVIDAFTHVMASYERETSVQNGKTVTTGMSWSTAYSADLAEALLVLVRKAVVEHAERRISKDLDSKKSILRAEDEP